MARTITIPPLASGDLKIAAALDGEILRIKMSGIVDMRDPQTILNPYWEKVDKEIVSAGLQQVELDVRGVDFMNSSGIICMVRWITQAKARAPDEAYHIVVQHEPAIGWQKKTIPLFLKLAPGLVTLGGKAT
ncbi:MAG TPA: hypothetical protein VH877_29355 [Polyangia bacterium]|jgi:hypothetical protein|nr:hypothetical protein [Polyangia bacterium]